MYKVNDKTKEMASYVLGVDVEEFLNFDYDEEIKFLQRNGRGCSFRANEDDRIVGRGNPLLARNKFLTMEEVNRGLAGEKNNMSNRTAFYEDSELQKELAEIYSQYHNSIKMYIGQLEVFQDKFPVEILNELCVISKKAIKKLHKTEYLL